MKCFHQDTIAVLRLMLHAKGLGSIRCEGFLTQHMFTRGKCFVGPLSVLGYRQGNINSIDNRVIQHRLVIWMNLTDVMGLRKCRRPDRVPCRNTISPGQRLGANGLKQRHGRNLCRAQYAKIERHPTAVINRAFICR